MKTAIVIPARFASTRLPGKPLLDIAGKPMIQHVYERARQVAEADAVVVATDDIRIMEAVKRFGGQAELTSDQHESGSDRLIELLDRIDADLLINIQGDEPLIRPGDISLLIDGMLRDPAVQIGTLCHEIDQHEAENPNIVKVIRADNQDALYFSRSKIPYARDGNNNNDSLYLKHVGVYAYRREILKSYGSMAQSMLEKAEKLEQLRFLTAGIKVRVFQVEPTGPGVDTQQCLERVRRIFNGQDKPIVSELLTERLKAIKLVVTDVDGVLTDGSIFYSETGECFKSFHVRDGLGMRMLEETGVKVVVLSGKDSPSLRKRVADLKITDGLFGISNKLQAIEELQKKLGVSKLETACIGDDSIDIPAFERAGLSFTVADAEDYIKASVDIVLQKTGGRGAFREVADAIIRAHGHGAILNSADGYARIMSKMVQ